MDPLVNCVPASASETWMELVVQNYSQAITLKRLHFSNSYNMLRTIHKILDPIGPRKIHFKTVLIGLLFFAPTTALFTLNKLFSSHPTKLLWSSTILPLISFSVIFTIISQRSVQAFKRLFEQFVKLYLLIKLYNTYFSIVLAQFISARGAHLNMSFKCFTICVIVQPYNQSSLSCRWEKHVVHLTIAKELPLMYDSIIVHQYPVLENPLMGCVKNSRRETSNINM